MNETPIEALKQDVEGLHDCKARHTATEYVTETFEGETVWEGTATHLCLGRSPQGVGLLCLAVSLAPDSKAANRWKTGQET